MKRGYYASCALLILVAGLVLVSAAAASYRDPGTGLEFPPKISELALVDVRDYEKEHPGLGTGIMYRTEWCKADVFIYTSGYPVIPPGIASPAVEQQFLAARRDIYALQQRGNYKDVATGVEREVVRVGDHLFLLSRISFTQDGVKRVSLLYLAGYRNRFLKIRITYYQDMLPQGERLTADFLRVLGGQLGSAPR